MYWIYVQFELFYYFLIHVLIEFMYLLFLNILSVPPAQAHSMSSVRRFVYRKPIQKYVCQNAWEELRGLNMRILKVSFGQLKPTFNTHNIDFYYTLEQIQDGQNAGKKQRRLSEDGRPWLP